MKINVMKSGDENLLKITEYKAIGELPNPFIFNNGSSVSSIEEWQLRRREISKTAVEIQFGTIPPSP